MLPEHESKDPTKVKQLSVWNPLDHLRLLWWVLVTPQRLLAYRETFGENAERSVGRWLVSTLVYLPIFIVTLALGLRILPRAEKAFSPTLCLWMSVGLTIAWVLTSQSDPESGCLTGVGGIVMLAVIDVAVSIAVSLVVAGVEVGMMGITALLVAFSAAVSSARILAFDARFGVVNLLGTSGVALALSLGFMGGFGLMGMGGGDVSEFIVVLMVFLTMSSVVSIVAGVIEKTVEKSLKTARPSRLAQGALGAILLVHAFLVWFSFFGGWRVFV
ncbi:MAG: hypothetical protein GY832_22340 [Chloroflexi bacterium]|nr:hypothetical protein [Chloroflexota bacterium]